MGILVKISDSQIRNMTTAEVLHEAQRSDDALIQRLLEVVDERNVLAKEIGELAASWALAKFDVCAGDDHHKGVIKALDGLTPATLVDGVTAIKTILERMDAKAVAIRERLEEGPRL